MPGPRPALRLPALGAVRATRPATFPTVPAAVSTTRPGPLPRAKRDAWARTRAGLLGLAAALLLPACRPSLPGAVGEEPALRTYRDSLLDLDLGYPEGWVFSEKKTRSFTATTHDLTFAPQNTLWTRRFLVKVMIPDRIPQGRTLEDLRTEYLERLRAAGDDVRLADTGLTALGGAPAFRARYSAARDGTPFTRHIDYLCLRGGREVSLSFEVAEAHAEEDIDLYRRIAERFRFYAP